MEKDGIHASVIQGMIVSIVYLSLYIAFLIMVVFKLEFASGYITSSIYIDDRYTWGWWFVFFNIVLRFFVPIFYVFTFSNLRSSMNRRWMKRYLSWIFVLDVITILFILIVRCFACNNESIPESPCNHPTQYCDAFYHIFPERCDPSGRPSPPLNPTCMDPHPAWMLWLYFTLGFFIGDFLLYFILKDMNEYVFDYNMSILPESF